MSTLNNPNLLPPLLKTGEGPSKNWASISNFFLESGRSTLLSSFQSPPTYRPSKKILPEQSEQDLFPTKSPAFVASYLQEIFLKGFSLRKVYEFSMPPGSQTREILLRAFSSTYGDQNLSHLPLLWVCGYSDLTVYPPAWAAHKIDLSKWHFCYSQQPLKSLKAVYSHPYFKIIIIDVPQRLSASDFAFLAQKARAHQKLIIAITAQTLSDLNPNPHAFYRINFALSANGQSHRIQCLKPYRLNLDIKDHRTTWQT